MTKIGKYSLFGLLSGCVKIPLAMALVFSLMTVGCISDDEPEIEEKVKVGDFLPEFTVTTNGGKIIATEDLRGQKGMIVFFNTSCPDCQQELPVVQEVYNRLRGECDVLCISRGEGPESVSAYWESQRLTLPCSAQSDRKVYELFATSIIPRIYVYSSGLRVTALFSDNPLPSAEQLTEALSDQPGSVEEAWIKSRWSVVR